MHHNIRATLLIAKSQKSVESSEILHANKQQRFGSEV